jgi:hypothetical protein
MSPGFDAWLAGNAREWDGSEAERLGVKGLGESKPKGAPAARVSTLADRLARRRSTRDKTGEWNVS